jgi:hypothetical protein
LRSPNPYIFYDCDRFAYRIFWGARSYVMNSHPRWQAITKRNETYSDKEAKNVYDDYKAAEIDVP